MQQRAYRQMVIVLVAATLLGACATTEELDGPAEARGAPAAAAAPAPREQLTLSSEPAHLDTRSLVGEAVSPAECVDFAKKVRMRSRADGWQVLNDCVLRAKFPRGAFTDMALLLDGTWDQDFASRPDALDLISKFIAFRGGDVATDLKAFQARRVPLFSLGAAVTQPDIFQGRMVLVRAQYDKAKVAARAVTAELTETALVQKGREYQYNGYRYHERSRVGVKSATESTYYGKSREDKTVSYADDSYYGYMSYENVAEPTGVKVLGKLPQADPFLEPGQEYLFLAKFEGLRTAPHEKVDDDDDVPKDTIALISILRYYAPHAAPVK